MPKAFLFPVLLLIGMLTGACIFEPVLDIQIGDFDRYRQLWDNQNMLDYQLEMSIFTSTGKYDEATLIIQNGLVVHTDPLSWPDVYPSTVPELFELIEESVQYNTALKKSKGGNYRSIRLTVLYNEDYFYPKQIDDFVSHKAKPGTLGAYTSLRWKASLVPVTDN